MQKIISFSLWGDNKMYTQGAIENVRLAKKFYPGWICHFAVHNKVDRDIIQRLIDMGAQVEIRNEDPTIKGRFWRIEIALKKDVERFIVRDTDSRIDKREADAVNAWIKSGKSFHFMYDHRFHTSPVMGGMWGAVARGLPVLFEEMYDGWIANMKQGKTKGRKYSKKNGFSDQGFLGNKLYPFATIDALMHSYKIKKGCKLFPTKRVGNKFVGQQFTADNKAIIVK